MIKMFTTVMLLLFSSLLLAERSEMEQEIFDYKSQLRHELGLVNLSKKSSSYENKRIKFEEKIYEFQVDLIKERCSSPELNQEKLCQKDEAKLLDEREFYKCNVKADQVWHQSSLTEDDLIQEATKLMSNFENVLERKKIWDQKKDCSEVLTGEHKKLAAYLESLKAGGNFEAETCEWVSDLPRKVVNLPGCRDNKNNNICTGYVSCNQKEKFGSGKFIRLATCQKKYCVDGEAKAQDCVKQEGFSSYAATDESEKMSVSDFMMSELQD